jgi:hypothetical protein
MRYFFNLAGAIYDPDNEGIELPDLAAARHHAVLYAADVISGQPEIVWKGEEVRVEVTDEGRMIMFTVVTFGVDAPLYAPMRPRPSRVPTPGRS